MKVPTKRVNWDQVRVSQQQESLWLQNDEGNVDTNPLKEAIIEYFRISEKSTSSPTPSPKDIIRVLDSRKAQTLSMLFARFSKNKSPEDFQTCFLNCDLSILTADFLQGLLSHAPTTYEVQQLKEREGEYNNLSEVEIFCFKMTSIRRLTPRTILITHTVDQY